MGVLRKVGLRLIIMVTGFVLRNVKLSIIRQKQGMVFGYECFVVKPFS